MMDLHFLYVLGYVMLSILGSVVSPFFFGAHILDIALQNPILQVRAEVFVGSRCVVRQGT